MILLDAAGPVLLAFFGAFAAAVALVLAVVVEAGVLRVLRWASTGRCFLDSLLMNVASTVMGIVLLMVAGSVASGSGVNPEDAALWWVLLAATFVLTVVIEAIALLLLHRGSGVRAWRASLVANVASYVLIAGLVILLSVSA